MSAQSEYERRLTIWTDSQAHLEFMHDAVLGYQKPVVIELGVAHGNTTSALLAACEEADGMLWSCDIQVPHVPVDWYESEHWNLYVGDDLSQGVLDHMPESCDVLFIDSDHGYDHVYATLRHYVPRVREGGVVFCHDTQWAPQGDTDLGTPGGMVALAIARYCGENDLEWTNRTGSYGLGVIKR